MYIYLKVNSPKRTFSNQNKAHFGFQVSVTKKQMAPLLFAQKQAPLLRRNTFLFFAFWAVCWSRARRTRCTSVSGGWKPLPLQESISYYLVGAHPHLVATLGSSFSREKCHPGCDPLLTTNRSPATKKRCSYSFTWDYIRRKNRWKNMRHLWESSCKINEFEKKMSIILLPDYSARPPPTWCMSTKMIFHHQFPNDKIWKT